LGGFDPTADPEAPFHHGERLGFEGHIDTQTLDLEFFFHSFHFWYNLLVLLKICSLKNNNNPFHDHMKNPTTTK